MRVTEQQLERWDNPPQGHSKRKKNVIVQHKGQGSVDPDDLFRKFLSRFYKDWSNLGKYETLDDASKALQRIVKDPKHIYHHHVFRVLLKGEHILKGHVTPENLALMLMHGKE